MLKAKDCFADPSWHRVQPDCYYYTVSTLYYIRAISGSLFPIQTCALTNIFFTRLHRYQAQVTLLTSLLRPKYGLGLEIGTVDGMQGREKEAVVISLVRSNNTVRSSFFRFRLAFFFSALWFDILERRRIPKRKEENEWYVLCVCLPGLQVNSMSRLLFFLKYYIVAMTRAKRHLVNFVRPIRLVDFWLKIFFSVLLEILQPSAMGVNILRNGWLGWKPMLTSSMQDWNEGYT